MRSKSTIGLQSECPDYTFLPVGRHAPDVEFLEQIGCALHGITGCGHAIERMVVFEVYTKLFSQQTVTPTTGSYAKATQMRSDSVSYSSHCSPQPRPTLP
jgi:hypothetical protein